MNLLRIACLVAGIAPHYDWKTRGGVSTLEAPSGSYLVDRTGAYVFDRLPGGGLNTKTRQIEPYPSGIGAVEAGQRLMKACEKDIERWLKTHKQEQSRTAKWNRFQPHRPTISVDEQYRRYCDKKRKLNEKPMSMDDWAKHTLHGVPGSRSKKDAQPKQNLGKNIQEHDDGWY